MVLKWFVVAAALLAALGVVGSADAQQAAVRQQPTYSDKYPDVISTKEQIRLLEARVAQEDKKQAATQAAAAASPRAALPPSPTARAVISGWLLPTPTCSA